MHTLLGTSLVAGGAAALNQVWERQTDRLMRRTRLRPLADVRMTVAHGTTFGLAADDRSAPRSSPTSSTRSSAIVALLTTASYVLFYTPLKLRTSLSTIVGALPGALPAVIGWAAATNTLSIEGWVLFGIVFMWQMPHFLAIAWMYRDEYARAGMPLLPVIEPDGRSTGRQAVLYTAALIPLSMLPTGDRPGHRVIPRRRDRARRDPDGAEPRVLRRSATLPTARRLFFGSILYLPILWALLRVRPLAHCDPMTVTDLPALNATLNAISTVLLVTGYVFIRRGDAQKHRAVHARGAGRCRRCS